MASSATSSIFAANEGKTPQLRLVAGPPIRECLFLVSVKIMLETQFFFRQFCIAFVGHELSL